MLMSHVVIQEHCSIIELSLHCSSICSQTGIDLLFIFKVRDWACLCLYLSFGEDWVECKRCWVVAYWPFCVFQSRWRWRRLLPRDPGLSAPFALPLCYPGSISARCLWQWRGCMALPCQPNAVRYRWFFCCLHLPCVFQTISGKSLVLFFILHSVTAAPHCCIHIFCLILILTFLFIAEHAKNIRVHHTVIRSLSWGKAPEDG